MLLHIWSGCGALLNGVAVADTKPCRRGDAPYPRSRSRVPRSSVGNPEIRALWVAPSARIGLDIAAMKTEISQGTIYRTARRTPPRRATYRGVTNSHTVKLDVLNLSGNIRNVLNCVKLKLLNLTHEPCLCASA